MAVNNEDFAIVIGIDNYPQLRPLGAAVKDAIAFAEWLVAPDGGGLPQKNVELIKSPEKQTSTDPLDAVPAQKDIEKVLRDWGVELNQRIGRRLYFYFSGHGFGPAFDDVGMLMANAANTRLQCNIGLHRYLEFFRNYALFDEVVFIVDCCRDPTLGWETIPPGFTLQRPDSPPKVLDFSVLAAAYGAKAFENTAAAEERRGILTKAVLEALNEKPSVDDQGRVTSSTLKQYVLKRVQELAAGQGKDQTPEFRDATGEAWVFGAATAPANLTVRIVPPAGFRGTVNVLHGNGLAVVNAHTFTADGEVWETALPRDSSFVIERADNGAARVLDPRKIKDNLYVLQL